MQPTVRRALYAVILLLGAAWVGLSADRSGSSTAGRIPAPAKGFLAPDFTLADPAGKQYTLSALRGKPVIVNVWATWCPPCRAEMPAIQAAYEQYRAQGLNVLGVNATSQDLPLNIVPFVQQYSITFPVLLDETGDVVHKYEVRSLPTTFFVNRDGTIAAVVVGGPMSEVLLRANIEDIVRSPAP